MEKDIWEGEVAVLETQDVRKVFGTYLALAGVSIRIEAGEIVGIVGPNGSGKTTFLNVVTGFLKPTTGRVWVRGREVTGLGPKRVTEMGVGRTFQIPQLWMGLTVLENVLLAVAGREKRAGVFWRDLRRREWVEEASREVDEMGLGGWANERADTLPEGGRKLLDVAMALALRPSLLLLDEPTSGVSAEERMAVMERVMEKVTRGGVTTVFVEHDLEIVRRYARRVLVFDEGRVVAEGSANEVLSSRRVRELMGGV